MRTGQKILRISLALALAIGLAACQVLAGSPPSKDLVKQAIAIELNQAQQALRQQLRMGNEPIRVQVERVNIAEQAPLTIESLPAFRVEGTYDYTVKLPKRQISRQHNPFEVYLQRQAENKTWRLARLQTDEAGAAVWVTLRVPQPA